HVWELMFTRSKYQTPDMIEQQKLLDRIADRLEGGVLKGILRETLHPLNAENLKKAHDKLESRTIIGKLADNGWYGDLPSVHTTTSPAALILFQDLWLMNEVSSPEVPGNSLLSSRHDG